MILLKTLYLGIGELIVAGDGYVVSTVLGSCVSVGLFAEGARVGGLIHYAMARRPPSPIELSEIECLRYGEFAIARLIAEVREMADSQVGRLTAKIVGGASAFFEGESARVGPDNVRIAERVLREAGILVTGRDVGGRQGRKVLFETGTGRLRVAV